MFQKSSSEPITTPSDEPTMTHDDIETVVGPSVHVEGDFASEGNMLIKGSVSGNVKTSKLLTVEQGAKIMANVRAGNAHISGEIKGNVKVKERIDLSASARIVGDISCLTLAVEPGALIHGKVTMKGLDSEEKSTKKRSARDKEPNINVA